jgi:hypothetical protein
VEALDLHLVGRVDVPDQHAEDEDGEEPGAVQLRRDAVHDAAGDEDADRVEPLARAATRAA